jgi:hypothetical protein
MVEHNNTEAPDLAWERKMESFRAIQRNAWSSATAFREEFDWLDSQYSEVRKNTQDALLALEQASAEARQLLARLEEFGPTQR